METLKLDTEKAKQKEEKGREQKPAGYGAVVLGICLILVVSVLAIGGWRAYTAMNADRELLAEIPRVQTMADGLERRVNFVEERLVALADRAVGMGMVEELSSRLSRFENALNAGLRAVRAELRQASADLDGRIRGDVDARLEDFRQHVSELERADEVERIRLDELEAELGAELAEIRHQFAEQLLAVRLRNTEASVQADDRILRAERRLDTVSYALERSRMDFEIFEDFAQEVVPGIYLQVSKTDRRMQYVSGWLRLIDDGRLVWIKDHPIQQSLTFYSRQDERPYELVFTRVLPKAAAGYLLVPSDTASSVAGNDGYFEPVATVTD